MKAIDISPDSNRSQDHELTGYQGLIRALYTKSKRRWMTGTIFTILALFPVHVLALLSFPRWCGLVAACVFAILGKWFTRWAGVLAGEADVIHRMDEYHRSFKWSIDRKKIADIRAKYRRIDALASKGKIENYYDHESYDYLTEYSDMVAAKLFMQSSWWTGKLANKAAGVVRTLLISLLIIIFLLVVWSWAAYASLSDRVIGLVVCIIIASDLVILKQRYSALERSSENAYSRISELHGREEFTCEQIMAVANEYTISRCCGPPIPESIYKYHRRRLNQLWKEELRVV